MTGISKIPSAINGYAQICARKISYQNIEHVMGFDYDDKGKIIKQSQPVRGVTENSTCAMDFDSIPAKIIVHNDEAHILSIHDIIIALSRKADKIFSSDKNNGYTAMDLTTINKEKNELDLWLYKAQSEFENSDISKTLKTKKDLNNYFEKKLKEFAEFSGAIFENVKWKNCPKFVQKFTKMI